MKVIKRILIGVLCIPFALIGMWVLFELFGLTVNHLSTHIQTYKLKQSLLNKLSSVEIVDTYSETGNTGPTGNHVDMLSVVIFKTDDSKLDIRNKLRSFYDLEEGASCFWSESWIDDMITVKEYRKIPYKYDFHYYSEMNIPENLEKCYMIYLNKSAPFVNNIEGH